MYQEQNVIADLFKSGHWVVASLTQRMAAGEAAHAEPHASQKPVTLDRFGGVIRTRRQKAA